MTTLRAPRSRARADRRGAISLMTAVMAPALLAMLALVVDAGFWTVGSAQLQVAADAAAMGAGQLLTTSLSSSSASTKQSALNAAALYEAQHAATKLVGTMNAPVATATTDFSAVTVTISSQAPGYLTGVMALFSSTPPTPPLLKATATATVKGGIIACVLTLGQSGSDINVGNGATLSATKCPIYSNSNGNPSIHAYGSGSISESSASDGTNISGTDIGAVGTIQADNGGKITAGTVTPNGSAAKDYVASGVTAPTAGTCSTGPSDFSSNNNGVAYKIAPQTWCNVNVNIGGNGNTVQLTGGGPYIVVNGNLTFNNATVTFAANTSFALIGSNPGNFSWTNYSNTSQPITAGANNIAIWQGCNSNGSQTSAFNGGSTLNITGIFYMPCSSVTVDNNAQLNAPIGQGFSIISKTLTVQGSGGVRTAATGNASSAAAAPVLTQ